MKRGEMKLGIIEVEPYSQQSGDIYRNNLCCVCPLNARRRMGFRLSCVMCGTGTVSMPRMWVVGGGISLAAK